MNYPIFDDPDEYLAFRRGNFIYAPFKAWFEWRAIERCLEGLDDISTVCDCPCGPGRIFSYWQKKSFNVIGIDLSEQMADAADKLHKKIQLKGRILQADAFKLNEVLDEKPDLIASVRFSYYFEKDTRIKLLKCFAQTTRKYVLVQYKTGQTIKGIINKYKSRKSDFPKNFCSFEDIINEVRQAGLVCVRIQPIAETSDRVFILAQKPNKKLSLGHKPVIARQSLQKRLIKSAAAAVIFLALLLSPLRHIVMDTHEQQIEHIVREYQDGNDHFYVSKSSFIEDLTLSKNLSVLSEPQDAESLVRTDQIEKEDSFFIVSARDISTLSKSSVWEKLHLLKKINIAGSSFFLLSTEQPRIPIRSSMLINNLSSLS